MTIQRGGMVGGGIETLFRLGAAGESEDRVLLERYARGAQGAEVAFRILVERHGSLVSRVCRELIGDVQDAEDATQAVFLVLARRAGSVRVGGSLAPWLYGVARRVAMKARGRDASRRRAEWRSALAAAEMRGEGPVASAGDWEMIHDEVLRLADRYRTVVLLCYWEGRTCEQAAREIGCPVGTVKVRLSRARERLRARLERRGIGAEGMAVVFLSEGAGPGVFGASRVEGMLRGVRALAMGREAKAGTLTTTVLTLYRGAIQAMAIYRWLAIGAGLVAAGGIGAGALVFAGAQDKGGNVVEKQGQSPPSLERVRKGIGVIADDPDVEGRRTRKAILEAARRRLEAQKAFYEEGRITIDRYLDASHMLMDAEMDFDSSDAAQLRAAKDQQARVGAILDRETKELEQGRGTVADVAEARQAYELAALDARPSRGRNEIVSLRRRVEALEAQLEVLRRRLVPEEKNLPPK